MVAGLVVLLLAICPPSQAARADDLDNITFQGVVRDTTGAVLAVVTVSVRKASTGLERSGETDHEGRYRIQVSEPGDYLLVARAPGFNDERVDMMGLLSGRVVTRDLVMLPAGLSEQVEVVVVEAARVDTTRTVVGDTIGEEELEGLPISSRDPLDLVFLLGGVNDAPLSTADLGEEGDGVFVRGTPEEAGIFSLTGAPATSNNITIDGLDNNDDRSARERIALSPESVVEVQVITNQYAAEYGRASGGRVNLRTRGGSNQHRGQVYFFLSDESLNANTFFRNARGLGRIPLQQTRVGATLSGPVRKSREFFFGSYERLDVGDFVEVAAFVPVEANPRYPLPAPNVPVQAGAPVGLHQQELPTPETRNLVNMRFDLNLTESHNASVRLDMVRGANRRGFPGGTRLPETLLAAGRDSESLSVSDNLVLSSRLINQARFQFSKLTPRNINAGDRVGIEIRDPRVVAGSFSGSASAPAFARDETRMQLQESVSWSGAAHLVKFGFDYQRVDASFTNLFAVGGIYRFDDVADFLANRPSRFIQRFNTTSRQVNNVVGVFVQDQWTVRRGLTLSLGGRWDSESIVRDSDNISPRISMAWDPLSGGERSGRTVVRSGFGVFYNRALLRTIDDFSLGRTTVAVDSDLRPELLELVTFPHPLIDKRIIDHLGVVETRFLRRIGPDLEIPYTIQTGLGVERQLRRKLVATADYVFTRGAHLWRESNINAPVLPEGFATFTEYLLSRDFDNRSDANGVRPISGVNADVVRFDSGASTSTTPGAISVQNGVRVLTLGLNTARSANIQAALNAIRFLRPDPSLTQVEMLESTGNSFYHGGIFSVRYSSGRWARLRVVYTVSKMVDEGTTNTASPQNLLDRRAERALSLQDQRHRLAISGAIKMPVIGVDLAPVIAFGSSRPFNIGSGFDRNLNDIPTDRPNFTGNLGRPVWRRPGSESVSVVQALLMHAPLGSNGNLPRNYGRGPGTRTFNLRASRMFAVAESVRIRATADAFNVFNSAIFSFGSEFIDRDDADFLVPRRTQRPRAVHLSLRVEF